LVIAVTVTYTVIYTSSSNFKSRFLQKANLVLSTILPAATQLSSQTKCTCQLLHSKHNDTFRSFMIKINNNILLSTKSGNVFKPRPTLIITRNFANFVYTLHYTRTVVDCWMFDSLADKMYYKPNPNCPIMSCCATLLINPTVPASIRPSWYISTKGKLEYKNVLHSHSICCELYRLPVFLPNKFQLLYNKRASFSKTWCI